MIICGIKVSHDGGVAVIDGNRLVFSTEIEKLGNRPRYSSLSDLDQVSEILRAENLDPREIDRFVVDGWYPASGATAVRIPTKHGGRPLELPVAPYVGDGSDPDPIARRSFPGVADSALRAGYASYTHAGNHVLGAYCTSPFAARGEDALVLAWDGGMLPRLYHVEAGGELEFLGPLFPLVGNIFGEFCAQLGPFRRDISALDGEALTRHELEVPGKAMAYAALGRSASALFARFDELLDQVNTVSIEAAAQLGQDVAARKESLLPGFSDADLIASFQVYIGRMLVDALGRVLHERFRGRQPNLCLSGGCALNIKWNSMLRDSGMFAELWVPPFPNDSGAAIGAACCEMVRAGGARALDWNVYSGPALNRAELPAGWAQRACDERQLAALLHREAEPVVVLHGRAELGPRALGNRSILAPATSPAMKDRLNDIKGRAAYRPVAPICLESRASEVFAPGGSDRYMVFEHRMQPGWAERVPAVVHLDGTARLQTIDPAAAGTVTGRILHAYEQLSGIPVLCNTSANLGGHGFFADVATAARWGRSRYVWSDGTLYEQPAAARNGSV